jgi:hypothetical protein
MSVIEYYRRSEHRASDELYKYEDRQKLAEQIFLQIYEANKLQEQFSKQKQFFFNN